jgi:hypothetical protein
MQEQLISFETAKVAKEKGYNIEGQTVFDLKNDNKIINFKDNAIQEFINDAETGYRDKALYYLKDGINVTDDNTDEGYFLLAPTQSLLQKWLREVHDILMNIIYDGNDEVFRVEIIKQNKDRTRIVFFIEKGNYRVEFNTYEEALEAGLQEALKLIK